VGIIIKISNQRGKLMATIRTGYLATVQEQTELSNLQRQLTQAELELAKLNNAVSERCTEIAVGHGLPKLDGSHNYGITQGGEFTLSDTAHRGRVVKTPIE